MATNEQNLPPEATSTGGTTAAGGAASAFERPVPPAITEEPVPLPPVEAPEVTIYRPGAPSRLVSLSRLAGRYAGTAVRIYRAMRREGIRNQTESMVRKYPATLAGAAAAGYIVGRVLSGR